MAQCLYCKQVVCICKPQPRTFSTYDGKYTTIHTNGRLRVLRHGEPWPAKDDALIGDGYVLSLVQHIEDLQDKIEELTQ